MATAPAKVSKARMPSGVPRYFQLGTDNRREVARIVRAAANAPAMRERRRLAGRVTPPPECTISPHIGFRSVPAHTFPELDEIAAIGREIGERFTPPAADANGGRKQQLFEDLLPQDSLDLESPFLRLALRSEVLEAVSAYLGAVPVLSEIDVWYSCWTPEFKNSQLLHCDWADIRQLKMFVFCTEVTEDNGPLTFIDAAQSKRLRRRLKYTYAGKRYRVQDDEAVGILGPEPTTSVLGAPGTLVFADTSSCFHLGSRVARQDAYRVVAMIQYLTPTAFCFPLRLATAPYSHLNRSTLSRPAQLALADGGMK